ncbi:MAG: Gfo/Idh/MocA family oxidoreductase [Anaerolineaceae bacterium]|nr:Gfo/Idh/MocA family oxidoreductase [Anaerolineaceae bacterium]
MKFLIAGFGSIGRRHFRNLLALGEKDIVLYRTNHSTLPTDETEGYPVETDLDAALAHKPDALIVANPTALHLPVSIPAAEAGCSIFMEKPISNSLEGIESLRVALEKGGGKLLMGYQFRFHPGLQKIKSLLDEKIIGEPLSIRGQWGEYLPGWHPWEDYRKSYAARADLGGGVVGTLSHPLDYMRWLLGEVKAVWAMAGKISDLQINVEDVAEIGLGFENSTLGSLHLNYFQKPGVHRLEVLCSQGTITWDNADGCVHVLRPEQPEEVFAPPVGFERNDLFLAETRHFIQVVRGEAKPICSLDDGLADMKLVQAIHLSSSTGSVVGL